MRKKIKGCELFLIVQLFAIIEGQFDANFTLQNVFGRLPQQAMMRSMIQCQSSDEAPNNIKFSRKYDTGQGTRLAKFSQQFIQAKPVSARILLMPSDDDLKRFGAYQCKVIRQGVTTTIAALKLPPFPLAELDAVNPHLFAFKGDNVELAVNVLKKRNEQIGWRHNGGELKHCDDQLIITLPNVQEKDAGIYECFYKGRRNESLHALMNLIVRGCPKNFFGKHCNEECPPCYNGGICHEIYGICVCPAGFTGIHCQQACGGNRFGADCNKFCTIPHNNSNMDNGCGIYQFCKPDPYGCSCAPGFKGSECMDHCEPGRYGANCEQPCHCAYGKNACNRITGFCSGGCEAGFKGESCEIEDPFATAASITTTMTYCEIGTYGASCEKPCHCSGNEACNISSGQCPSGCEDGWSGPSCGVCISGRFGQNCDMFCHCEGGNSKCDLDGYCISGCEAGWAGFTCEQECTPGRFGPNCALSCHCISGSDPCDKITGNCTGDCEPGFMGHNCQTICSPLSYGINCENVCSCHNGGHCNRIDGTCTCEGKWRGQVCNESQPQILAARDVETNAGQIVFISCTADAIPEPEMNIISRDFPGIGFNVITLDKHQYQAVVKMKPQNEGAFEFSCSVKNLHGFDEKIVTLTVITPPKLLSVPKLIEASNTSITVKWKPWTYLVDFGGKIGDNIEYLVLHRESTLKHWKTFNTWTNDNIVKTKNLEPYREYEIAIKCRRRGSGGEGGESPYLTVRTKCGEPLPESFPQDFLAEIIISDFVKLTWKPPPKVLLRCNLIGYVLTYKPERNSSTAELAVDISNHTREIMLYNLTPHTLYQLHLYPQTSFGLSKYPAELVILTSESVPGPVQRLQSEPIQLSDSLLISWEEPVLTNGVIKSYSIMHQLTNRGQCNQTNDGNIINKQSVLSYTTEVYLKNLFAYTTYKVTVAAETAAGEGSLSHLMVTTAQNGPDVSPPNLHIVSSTSISIGFEWESIPCELANGIIIEYEYMFAKSEFLKSSHYTTSKKNKRLVDSDIGAMITKSKIKDLAAVVGELQPYTEYTFAVRAYTEIAPGPFSDFRIHRTEEAAPPSPERFVVVSSSSHHIKISWFSPTPTNGIIQKYEIQYWSAKDLTPIPVLYLPENTKQIFGNISNLQPASDYILKVRASTNAGWGDWSEQIIGRTQDDVPGPPTRVKLIDVTETSLDISWESPDITYGFIMGYKITYNALSSLDPSYLTLSEPPNEILEDSSSTSIQDLHASTQYSVLIQARTSAGYGSPVSIICWTTVLGDHVSPEVEILNYKATNESIPVIFSTDGKSAVYKYQVIVEAAWNTEPINESLLSNYTIAVVENELPYYIAAELDPKNIPDSGLHAFVVGDKKTWGSYMNVHLNAGHKYKIRIRTLVEKDKVLKSIISEPKEHLAVTSIFPTNKKRRREILGFDIITFSLIAISTLVLIFIICFIVLFICKRKQDRKSSGKVFSNRDSGISDSLTWSVMYKVSDNEVSDGPLVSDGWKYSSTADKSSLKKNKMYAKSCQGIRVENLNDYLNNPNTSIRIVEEFKKLVSGQAAPWTIARRSENLKKNRYGNILPYDRYRVVLEPEQNTSDSDYINASYVNGYGQHHEYNVTYHEYIVTQGPLDVTIGDFWRMVWQENCPVIIMLTNLVENGKQKCSTYWPDSMEKQTMEIQNMQILLIHTETFSDFIIRTILIKKTNDERTHRVIQYQFTGWPDGTVPTNPHYLLKIMKKVRSDHTVLSGPIVVHCSAGAGRSGTYVALDSLMRQGIEDGRVDIFRCVNNARMQRINLIQTLEQYIFIHEALLEAISTPDSSVPLPLISSHLKEMKEDEFLEPKSLIRKQFQLLKTSQKAVDMSHCNVALSEGNIFKNRNPMTVPADTLRVRLLSESDTPELDDYINAVFVDGYHQKNCYLVTQMPMQHTIEDFLQLVYQNQSSLILMLNNFYSEDFSNIGQYWPNSGQCSFGSFEMQVVQFEEHKDLIIRILNLINYKQPSCDPHKIVQLEYTAWTYNEQTPISAKSFLALINIVEEWYQRSSGGPITVHCMDGASRSGLFCSAVSVCQQLISENSLDVYQIVKNIQISRPEFVNTLEQFAFCFEVANELVSTRAQSTSTQTRSLKRLCNKI